jgi:uncharacterized protein involved in exopolysaccharide biosynthesis
MDLADTVKEIRALQPPTPHAALPPEIEKMRDTIREVVGKLAEDVLKNLKALREQIDDLERLVVADAARVTENLTGHANIVASVHKEIERLTGVLEEIRAKALMSGEDYEHAT